MDACTRQRIHEIYSRNCDMVYRICFLQTDRVLTVYKNVNLFEFPRNILYAQPCVLAVLGAALALVCACRLFKSGFEHTGNSGFLYIVCGQACGKYLLAAIVFVLPALLGVFQAEAVEYASLVPLLNANRMLNGALDGGAGYLAVFLAVAAGMIGSVEFYLNVCFRETMENEPI